MTTPEAVPPVRPVRTVPPTGLAAAELARRKPEGLTVSVCLPARDEATTVGSICEVVRQDCMVPDAEGRQLVDELVVLDDGSADATAAVAEAAGATVVAVGDVPAGLRRGRGKGNVLWTSLAASHGDLVVWCDADLLGFSSTFVTRLVAPLLEDPTVAFVKAFYERTVDARGDGGGRTTELVARPLLQRFFPELATLRQPLAGECAARRALLEQVPFVEGYGVEVGLLVDVLAHAGLDAMVQVDLGRKAHRHRTLAELSVQAGEILDTVLARAGLTDGAGVVERPPMAATRNA